MIRSPDERSENRGRLRMLARRSDFAALNLDYARFEQRNGPKISFEIWSACASSTRRLHRCVRQLLSGQLFLHGLHCTRTLFPEHLHDSELERCQL